MTGKLREHLTYANVVATIGLVIALGLGSAWAASLSKNSVGPKQISKNAVKAPEIAKNAVRSPEIRAGAVGTAEVGDGSLLGEDFAPGQLPAGPPGERGLPGEDGEDGTDGADGTARAYARVVGHAFVPCALGPFADECSVDHSKGIGDVTHPSVGVYCVEVPGISPSSVPAAATVEFQGTSAPEGNASAMWRIPAALSDCPSGWFEVSTERHGATTDATAADTVSFTIVIP